LAPLLASVLAVVQREAAGGVQQWGKLFEDLHGIEQRHRSIVEHLETIKVRLLVAMTQADADEAA
jgi:hypothetical protein